MSYVAIVCDLSSFTLLVSFRYSLLLIRVCRVLIRVLIATWLIEIDLYAMSMALRTTRP